MTYVTIDIGHHQQPAIDNTTWPLRIDLDDRSVLTVHGEHAELAAWTRAFAGALAAKADDLDAASQQAAADLDEARAEVSAARVAAGNETTEAAAAVGTETA